MRDGKMEETICFKKCIITPNKRYCRVVLNRDLATADLSSRDLTKRFNVFLNFIVIFRMNSLMSKRELTSRQEEIYELIKSLHDSGLGYRRIAKRLRDMNIKTAHGSVFKNNNVFAVIKRYEERQVRIREERNRKYEHKWGKMYLTFERK